VFDTLTVIISRHILNKAIVFRGHLLRYIVRRAYAGDGRHIAVGHWLHRFHCVSDWTQMCCRLFCNCYTRRTAAVYGDSQLELSFVTLHCAIL